MTLGLTQPVKPGDIVPGWEVALKAKEQAKWPHQILFDLLTYWLDQKPKIQRGLFLPLSFFLNASDQLCAGLAGGLGTFEGCGSNSGLLFWDDSEHLPFQGLQW